MCQLRLDNINTIAIVIKKSTEKATPEEKVTIYKKKTSTRAKEEQSPTRGSRVSLCSIARLHRREAPDEVSPPPD